MTHPNYLFLALMWTALIILTKKQRWGLKEKILAKLGRFSEIKDSSVLGVRLAELKAKAELKKNEEELSEALSYIKNLVVLGRGQSMSTQLLLSELAELCPNLSNCFTAMAASVNLNNYERAGAVYRETFKEGPAGDVSELLLSWESIPPEDLTESVESYRSALREQRLTQQIKSDEALSDLIYFPVVLNAMVVLMNFIYVAYFIEQRANLTGLFY